MEASRRPCTIRYNLFLFPFCRVYHHLYHPCGIIRTKTIHVHPFPPALDLAISVFCSCSTVPGAPRPCMLHITIALFGSWISPSDLSALVRPITHGSLVELNAPLLQCDIFPVPFSTFQSQRAGFLFAFPCFTCPALESSILCFPNLFTR